MVQNFTSHLRVSKQIVSLLSKSTYQKSFAYAIRELVSNAYDADALTVKISIHDDYIEVEDDGNGMSRSEFDRYLTIAGSKNESTLTRRYKRKRIGQFGVGFLSIFPFCESLEIITTAENSSELLSAKIPAKNFFELDTKTESVEEVPIYGNILNKPSEKFSHYTKIRLVNPTYLVQQYFSRPQTKKRDSNMTWEPFKRFEWELQEDLPIGYHPESEKKPAFAYDEPIGINVLLNGKPIYRNNLADSILEEGVQNIFGIECKFVFTTNYKSILPMEARGIKRRVNNVGIGPRTDFSLKRNRGFSRLHWIKGEIWISEKVKEFLNISREAFVSNPVMEDIDEYFAEKLSKWAYYVERVSESETKIEDVLKNNKREATKPNEEILRENVTKLEKSGFTIIQDNSNNNGTRAEYKIDKTAKTVTISTNPETISREYIHILDTDYEIEYTSWDFLNNDFPACRFGGNNRIEINQTYPLFKSRSHGKIFLKMSIILLVAASLPGSSAENFKMVSNSLINEFNDYI